MATTFSNHSSISTNLMQSNLKKITVNDKNVLQMTQDDLLLNDNQPTSKTLSINIGGRVFCIGPQTIIKSRLLLQISEEKSFFPNSGIPVVFDNAGNFFIDRNSNEFADFLEYLRTGELEWLVDLPESTSTENSLRSESKLMKFLKTCAFYGSLPPSKCSRCNTYFGPKSISKQNCFYHSGQFIDLNKDDTSQLSGYYTCCGQLRKSFGCCNSSHLSESKTFKNIHSVYKKLLDLNLKVEETNNNKLEKTIWRVDPEEFGKKNKIFHKNFEKEKNLRKVSKTSTKNIIDQKDLHLSDVISESNLSIKSKLWDCKLSNNMKSAPSILSYHSNTLNETKRKSFDSLVKYHGNRSYSYSEALKHPKLDDVTSEHYINDRFACYTDIESLFCGSNHNLLKRSTSVFIGYDSNNSIKSLSSTCNSPSSHTSNTALSNSKNNKFNTNKSLSTKQKSNIKNGNQSYKNFKKQANYLLLSYLKENNAHQNNALNYSKLSTIDRKAYCIEMQPSSNNARYKTKMCPFFRNGLCNRSASDCKFAHSLDELRGTKEFFKTQICFFWSAGHCRAGTNCRHAHGNCELRHSLKKKKK